MELDGYGEPVFIQAEMRVLDEGIVIDYTGTSPASAYGVNSPLCYTEAYTCFGLKCIIAPAVPNNHGSLSVFRTVAEPGSAVHPLHPSRLPPATSSDRCCRMWPSDAFPGATRRDSGGERGEHLGTAFLQWRWQRENRPPRTAPPGSTS